MSQRMHHVRNRCLILKKADSEPCCESNSVSVPHKAPNDVFIIRAEHLLMLGLQVCTSVPLLVRWTPPSCDRRIRGGGRFTRWWRELRSTPRRLSCRGSSHRTQGTTFPSVTLASKSPRFYTRPPCVVWELFFVFVINNRTWGNKKAYGKKFK